MSLKNQKNKLTALALSAVLFASVLAPISMAENDGNIIKISTAEEFVDFAKKCKTDTWSHGKTVELTADIDFSKTVFSPVPTFGGTFKGSGHKITGVNITSKGSYQGIFRYVQAGGRVDNLRVEGKITPDGSRKYIGGIVGENSGEITGCTFTGDVSGSASVGGICGYITKTGVVSGCDFNGTVSGESYTGGICGQNYGTINQTENHGSVNTKNIESDKSLQDINVNIDIDTLENTDKTELIDTNTDTGGICGYTKGTISGCKNYGNVGYKSVGYNTGGISGRTAGYISECENHGEINGRKDIGGISGQAEPYILLEYSGDILEDMNSTLSEVRDIINDSLDSNSGSGISSSLDGANDALANVTDRINNAVTGVSDSIGLLSDDITSYSDSVSQNVNDLTDRLDKALGQSEAVFDNLSTGTDKLGDGLLNLENSCEYLKKSIDDIKASLDKTSGAAADIKEATKYLESASSGLSLAMDDLYKGTSALKSGTKKLQRAVRKLQTAIKDKGNAKDDLESIFSEIWQTLGEILDALLKTENGIQKAAEIIQRLKDEGFLKNIGDETIASLKNLANCYRTIIENIISVRDAILVLAEDFDIYSFSSAFSLMSAAFDNLTTSFDKLGDASLKLKDAVDSINNTSDDASDAINSAKDGLANMKYGTDSLKNSIDELNNIVKTFRNGDTFKFPALPETFSGNIDNLQDSIKNLRNEFGAVPNVVKEQKGNITDSVNDSKNKLRDNINDIGDRIEELSDMLRNAYDGRTSLDKDNIIEDISDLDKGGNTPGKIESSANYGRVIGDKNVGGVIGAMAIEYDFDPEDDVLEQGDKTLNFTYKTKCIVRRCTNEAEITSKKDYCGGIVGKMDLGSLMSCDGYGKIMSEDGDYIGGIAGKSATVVRSSAARCDVSGNDYVGGIVGDGSKVADCHSLVHVSGYSEFGGAVSGAMPSDAVKGNYCVNDELGAIDDINYTGLAEEEDIGSFVNFVKSNFNKDVVFTLKFIADDKEIAKIEFNYKDKIPESKIPKVPDKKGYYGKWSYYDFNSAEFDADITAEYNREMNILASDEKRDDKSVILICGSFDDNSKVYAEKSAKSFSSVDGYDVSIEGCYTDKYTVRYLPETENARFDLMIDYGEGAQKINTDKYGSYVQFEASSPKFTVYEVKKDYTGLIICSVLIAAAAVAMIFMLRKRNKKSKK